MPEESKLAAQTRDYVSAWDERKRTFDALRNQRLNDEQRTEALQNYIAASRHFEELRGKLIKH